MSGQGSSDKSPRFCSQCGAEIEVGSSFCVSCGSRIDEHQDSPQVSAPLLSKLRSLRWELSCCGCGLGFVGAVALIVIAVATTCQTAEGVAKEIKDVIPATEISASALWSAYEANEVAADEQYKGKILLVTGTITDIGKDILFDTPYIVMGEGIQCYFADSEIPKIADLEKNKGITVKGKGHGKAIFNVSLRGCTIQNDPVQPSTGDR